MSSNNILPHIASSSNNSLTKKNGKSIEKYQFNESISTNTTGLASNQLNELTKVGNNIQVEAPKTTIKKTKHTAIDAANLNNMHPNSFINHHTQGDASDDTERRARSISRIRKQAQNNEKL